MDEYTYKLPEANTFLKNIVQYLQLEEEPLDRHIANLLSGATCEYFEHSYYNQRAWDQFDCTMTISIPIEKYKKYSESEKFNSDRIKELANKILSNTCGYYILIEVIPKFDEIDEPSLPLQVINVLSQFPTVNMSPLYKKELEERGKEMAEIYMAFYYIENSMRIFIDGIFKKNYGEHYVLSNYISKETLNSISNRKQTDEKNKWLEQRGNSDLYYLDFKDIPNIISKNWKIFEEYFPDQNWMKVKFDEIVLIRNLIAHNSYVTQNGKQTALINFNHIMTHISDVK